MMNNFNFGKKSMQFALNIIMIISKLKKLF